NSAPPRRAIGIGAPAFPRSTAGIPAPVPGSRAEDRSPPSRAIFRCAPPRMRARYARPSSARPGSALRIPTRRSLDPNPTRNDASHTPIHLPNRSRHARVDRAPAREKRRRTPALQSPTNARARNRHAETGSAACHRLRNRGNSARARWLRSDAPSSIPRNFFSHLEADPSRADMIPLQRAPFMPPFSCQFTPEAMRDRTALKPLTLVAVLMLVLASFPFPARAQDANAAKARALVDAAIKMTDSDAALKLLWQATEIDPTFDDAYVYLGLYYNSRSDFTNVVKVYQKLLKYQPNQVSAYLNIGEAYMSFSPARTDDALVYYRKGYELDPKNTFAALRIGELLAQTGQRDDALKYLKIALGDSAKNPTVASEAEKTLKQMGAL